MRRSPKFDVGARVELREIRPDDAERLVAFHTALSANSKARRFLAPHPLLTPVEVQRFTRVDGDDRTALVVVDAGIIIGVARYDRDPARRHEAETAFVVADARQGEGFGTLLLASLVDVARQHGITRFTADTQSGNADMMRVFRHSGFDLSTTYDHGIVHVEFSIAEAAMPGARERPSA